MRISYDAETGSYDRTSWQYQGVDQLDPDEGDSSEYKETTRPLQTGAAGMERAAQVPKEIALVMQAVIILFVASRMSLSLTSPRGKDKGGDGDA